MALVLGPPVSRARVLVAKFAYAAEISRKCGRLADEDYQ
jgi:hypothetical protein